MVWPLVDHASAAPWHPRALAAHAHVAEAFPGDPARLHTAGRQARDLLERCRSEVARICGAPVEGVTFTSGGTEAVHLAVRGVAAANRTRPRRILSAAVEHSAVLAAADATDHEHVRLPVDAAGVVDLDALAAELRVGAALLNLQHANHEVGTLQPVAEAAALCAEHDALLHVDACQTVGRLPVDLGRLGADLVSCSAAKFGGGRGTGALLAGPRARLRPLVTGDERERHRRAGLEDLPGVAAMTETLLALAPSDPDGEAAREVRRADPVRRRLRDLVRAEVPDAVVHGPDEGTLPHLVALSALYVEGQALVTALDAHGWAVHSGSSCATTSGEPSHVLVAMGALTQGHVRVSFGPDFDDAAADALTAALAAAVATQRRRLGVTPGL